MEHDKNIQDELRALAPRLAKMEKSNPFSVPENYFETLPSVINEKVVTQRKKFFAWNGLFRVLLRPQYAISFAVLIVAVLVGVKFFSLNNSVERKFDKITADEWQEYVRNNIDEYDESELGLYCCSDLKSTDFLFKNEKEQKDYINKYLLEDLREEDIL